MVTFDWMDKVSAEARSGNFVMPTEAQTERTRQGINQQLVNNPILQRYGRALSTPDFHCTLPWHAQGDRLNAAFGAILYGSEAGPGTRTQNGVGVAMTLLAAQVYLWSHEMREIAWDMPLPRHIIARDQMPYPLLFFCYETALPVKNDVEGAEMNWMLLAHSTGATGDSGGINICHDITLHDGSSSRIVGAAIKYNTTYPTDIPEESLTPTTQILGMLAFINSPFIDTSSHAMPRTIRRELQRTGNSQLADLQTTVVTLRRKQATTSKNENGEETQEWSARWWVSGHIRAQWYPSLKAHKLIFIAPYIKGPENKPIRPKTYMVVR